MPDVKQVYEMVTQQTGPQRGALERQFKKRDRKNRNRKLSALALGAAVVMATVILIVTSGPAGERGSTVPATNPPPAHAKDGFYAVDTITGNAQLISKGSFSGGNDVSPDGTRIAFSSEEAGTRQIYVMNADGTGKRRISSDEYEARDPDWSPDGRMLAYVGFGRGTRRNVFVLNLSTGEVRQLTHEPRDVRSPDWSPDGDRILYTEGEPGRQSQLRTVTVATGKITTLTDKGEEAAEGSWSPDGSRIVYTLDGVGNGDGTTDKFHGIWTSDAQGHDRQELIATHDGTYVPVWSPDGANVAYFLESAASGASCCDVYIADARTGESRNLIDGLWPTWLDDETLLVERYSDL
jgi:Tol biopolymer transport system component